MYGRPANWALAEAGGAGAAGLAEIRSRTKTSRAVALRFPWELASEFMDAAEAQRWIGRLWQKFTLALSPLF